MLVLSMTAGLPVLAGGCASPGGSAVKFDVQEWSYQGAKGSIITSLHYVLYTTCTAKPLANAMPVFLESCWAAYAELVPCDTAPDHRLQTYLFQERWQWERFTEEFAPNRSDTYKRIRSGGYSERGITVSHYGSRRTTLSTLAHEGLHQYLEITRGGRIPAWINEGLATRFEAFDLDAKNRPIFTPERNYLRLNHLRAALTSHSLAPLPEILATHAGIEIQKPTTRVAHYYAQAWSLVLYLLQPPRVNPYHDGFRRLLQELGTDAMVRSARAYLAADTDGTMSEGEAVFRAYVTDDLEKFQQDYEAFLRKLLRLET
jgi:hypothetical protein